MYMYNKTNKKQPHNKIQAKQAKTFSKLFSSITALI